jgi:S-methylmethionine-dependent homocysteine/selenocysteine methylase
MMTKYRNNLPQLKGGTFLNDGGMETTLIFLERTDLQLFASFVLLADPKGRAQIKNYYRKYLELAAARGVGIITDTATWRASADWGAQLGFGPEALWSINQDAAAVLAELRAEYETPSAPIVISGQIGPRGDGYKAGRMDADEAEAYHAAQIAAFVASEADMVGAYTMNTIEEALGVARAAKAAGMPCTISFTVETDGRLVTGASLEEAITTVDETTDASPVYYMINCAHPTHFAGALRANAAWLKRIGGVKANASAKSHAELDEATELDEGDPHDLALRYRAFRPLLPNANVLGGCCGTDHRHIEQICINCLEAA